MKLNAYSIYDSATGAYARPFFSLADGDATRQFGDIAQDADHPIGKHPEHYSLFRIGLFDDSTGKFHAEELEHLANAHEMVANVRNGIDVAKLAEESPGLTA